MFYMCQIGMNGVLANLLVAANPFCNYSDKLLLMNGQISDTVYFHEPFHLKIMKTELERCKYFESTNNTAIKTLNVRKYCAESSKCQIYFRRLEQRFGNCNKMN